MIVLNVHVRYRQRGGEDVVVQTEALLLRNAGNSVVLLDPSSNDFDCASFSARLGTALNLGNHDSGCEAVRQAILEHQPDVVHFHNLYPLFGPGAIAEAARLGCATVQTLHNYRLTCLAGTHFRDDRVCEACGADGRFMGILRGCYRGSRLQSLALARGVDAQWRLLREKGLPDVLICLTGFMRERLRLLGVPSRQIVVKPNGVPSPSVRRSFDQRRGALFVGRLSEEKGIGELLDVWSAADPPLRIVGSGPLEARVQTTATRLPNVTFVGSLGPQQVREEMSAARVVVVPSKCFEGGLPLVVLEAMSEGTPVIGFSQGAMLMLQEVDSELLVSPNDFHGLRGLVRRVCEAEKDVWASLSAACIRVYEQRYTLDCSLDGLLNAYSLAIERSRLRRVQRWTASP